MSGSGPHDARRRRTGLGLLAVAILVVGAGAIAHVWVKHRTLEMAYAIGKERKKHEDMLEQRRRLQIELGMLRDPAHIVKIAGGDLGMGPPEATAILLVRPGDPPIPAARLANALPAPPPPDKSKRSAP